MQHAHGVIWNYETLITSGATQYIEIPVSCALVTAVHIRWRDATSSATITLESSNEDPDRVSGTSTTAGDWIAESSVTITGPSASAAGGSMLHLANFGSERARLKVVAAADTRLRVTVHGKS